MKCTISRLKQDLDTTASAAEIVAKLRELGFSTETEDLEKALDGFIVGHVVACEQHPNADRLRCLQVDTGTETLHVVCGAPNARAGMKGVFAPVGCYVPGADFKIKKAKIRGEESCGMMCSERELLLSQAHEGIIELPEDAVAGTPAAQVLNRQEIILTVTAPAPDKAAEDAAEQKPEEKEEDFIRALAAALAEAGLGVLKPV